jgi:superfamily II DNA/RNA helicase
MLVSSRMQCLLVRAKTTPLLTYRLLKRLERIMQGGEQKTMIFTQTKRTADDITRMLRQDGWPALGKI